MPVTLRRPLAPAKAETARKRALTEIENSIEDAARAHQRVLRLRSALADAQLARDALVRQAAHLGAAKTELAKRCTMTRQSLYEILNRPDDDDGEYIEHLVDLAIEAQERWDANGQQGEPDDYWPV